MARVVVGLSGGVDSSLAAALLLEQGHEVIGLFMRNWNDASVTLEAECPWIEDSNDALLVAEHLGIPFQVMDLSGPYKERIVDTMFAEYQAGRTPNPDVLCNREIKFDLFLEAALKLGAEYVATGHYAQRREEPNGQIALVAGADPNKDQSYFLCQLNQEQLRRALFPIGAYLKSDVRLEAEKRGIPTAQKKDSQGLCFIGKVRLPDFLQQKLQVKVGSIVEISPDWEGWKHPEWGQPWPLHPDLGTAVGTHSGRIFLPSVSEKDCWWGAKPSRCLYWPSIRKRIRFMSVGRKTPGAVSPERPDCPERRALGSAVPPVETGRATRLSRSDSVPTAVARRPCDVLRRWSLARGVQTTAKSSSTRSICRLVRRRYTRGQRCDGTLSRSQDSCCSRTAHSIKRTITR